MRNEHVWKESTEAGQREVKAVKFGGKWRLQSKIKGDAVWAYHDMPALADLETLRDLLFRKYQRRRASYDDVQAIERMIEAQGKPNK